jgi:hypothetical protein
MYSCSVADLWAKHCGAKDFVEQLTKSAKEILNGRMALV